MKYLQSFMMAVSGRLVLTLLVIMLIALAWTQSARVTRYSGTEYFAFVVGLLSAALVRPLLLASIVFGISHRLKKPVPFQALLGPSLKIGIVMLLAGYPWEAWAMGWMRWLWLVAVLILLTAFVKWALQAPWRQTIAATVLVIFAWCVCSFAFVGLTV